MKKQTKTTLWILAVIAVILIISMVTIINQPMTIQFATSEGVITKSMGGLTSFSAFTDGTNQCRLVNSKNTCMKYVANGDYWISQSSDSSCCGSATCCTSGTTSTPTTTTTTTTAPLTSTTPVMGSKCSTPNQEMCSGGNPWRCTSGGLWLEETTCRASLNENCVVESGNAYCKYIQTTVKICDAGAYRCAGSTSQICRDNNWYNDQVCSNGCVSTTGKCKAGCTLNTNRCYQNLAQSCISGTSVNAWTTSKDCAASGQECVYSSSSGLASCKTPLNPTPTTTTSTSTSTRTGICVADSSLSCATQQACLGFANQYGASSCGDNSCCSLPPTSPPVTTTVTTPIIGPACFDACTAGQAMCMNDKYLVLCSDTNGDGCTDIPTSTDNSFTCSQGCVTPAAGAISMDAYCNGGQQAVFPVQTNGTPGQCRAYQTLTFGKCNFDFIKIFTTQGISDLWKDAPWVFYVLGGLIVVISFIATQPKARRAVANTARKGTMVVYRRR